MTPSTQRAIPQERKEIVSLRSKTVILQEGEWVRMDVIALVPACVQPITTTFEVISEFGFWILF